MTLLVAPLSALAQPAATGEMSAIARTYFENGNRAFAEHRYGEACNAFREAHAITHRPELLFNIGRSCAEAGQYQQSLDALTLFESAGGSGVDRHTVDDLIASVRQHLAEQPPPAQTPPPPPPSSSAPPPPPPPPPPPTTRVEYHRSTLNQVGPWVLVGLGAASTTLGLLAAVDAANRVNQVRLATTGSLAWSSSINEQYKGAPEVIGGAWLFTTLGVGMIAGGVVWVLLRGPGERREVPITVGVAPMPSGGVLGVGGVF